MKMLCAWFAIAVAVPNLAYAEPVPLIGCASDGQTGAQQAPRQGWTEIAGAGRDAARLADYVMADGTRTLAPRGWHCAGLYGSDGSVLFVTPDLATLKALLANRRVSTPAVIRHVALGDTSGRFAAARAAAMLFPAASRFVAQVEAEKITAAFRHRLWPGDRVTHLTPFAALYTTPAGVHGIGTDGPFAPGALPVDGMAALSSDDDHNLETMSARLEPAMRPLVADIISAMRRQLGIAGGRR